MFSLFSNKEIPDSLRLQLEDFKLPYCDRPEEEWRKYLKSYPKSDFLLSLEIEFMMNNLEDVPRLISSIKSPGTYTLGAIGYYYSYISQYETAERYYQKSIKADTKKQNWIDRVALAEILDSFGELDSAKRYYSEALEISPNNLELKFRLADNMENRGEIQQSMYYLNQIPLDYKPAYRLLIEGNILMRNNDYQQAKEKYLESLRIDSSQTTVKMRLAQFYNMTGNYNEAEGIILPLVVEYPYNVDYLYMLAISYMGNNKHQKAIEVVKKIEKLDEYIWESINFLYQAVPIYISVGLLAELESALIAASHRNKDVEIAAYLLLVHKLMSKDINKEIQNFLNQYGYEANEGLKAMFYKFNVEFPKDK